MNKQQQQQFVTDLRAELSSQGLIIQHHEHKTTQTNAKTEPNKQTAYQLMLFKFKQKIMIVIIIIIIIIIIIR
jgi:hypothetical protein